LETFRLTGSRPNKSKPAYRQAGPTEMENPERVVAQEKGEARICNDGGTDATNETQNHAFPSIF
jgi:hypothetical protein